MLLLFVRICCLICRKLSASHCRTLGRFLGWIWYRILPIRRSVVRLQMARAYPEWAPKMVEEHVRRMYLHWGESFVEFMRYGGLHGLPSPPLKLEGEAFMREALSLGRGVLVLTAHIGNFELTLRAAAQSGLPLTVVTKTMHSLTAERVWRYLRSGPGDALVKFCPTKGCAREVLRDLASGGMVAYVFDQHASGRHATEVGFFGQPAETSTDLARLQRLTGAPIVPVFGYRADDGHHVRIEAPIWAADASSLEQVTARCTAEIERAVRAHPEQWLWLHRRWKRSKQAKKDEL